MNFFVVSALVMMISYWFIEIRGSLEYPKVRSRISCCILSFQKAVSHHGLLMALRAYFSKPVARQVIMPQARCNMAIHVVTVRALNRKRQRNAVSFRQQAALNALLASVRRVRPGGFEPESGAFVIAPSIDSPDQLIPFSPSYSISPSRQKASNTPASVHSRKRLYAELHEQILQRIPLAAGAEQKQNGIHGIPIWRARIVATQRMRFARR